MSPLPDTESVRLSLPSKGRLARATLEFLAACGLPVERPHARSYGARLPALPELTVLFQRPGDIVVGVRDGIVEFGITGLDMVAERGGDGESILILHDDLRFGQCRLCVAVPEAWDDVRTMADLAARARRMERPLRVATRFPRLTGRFLNRHQVRPFVLVPADGTLEVTPAIGYADLIADLVSSGQTLRENRLRPLEDGEILSSQAVLIAHRLTLEHSPRARRVARYLLEFIEAHLRAQDAVSVFANMRGSSPEEIARRMFGKETLGGLQGPTISPVIVQDGNPNWYAVHIVVRRDRLFQAIQELRSIGGSGVVVAPALYIFEEEPDRWRAVKEALELREGDNG
ncbi:MAG: ATP phosphoribosyltransferase [Anaerolineae bacterium]